MSVATLIDRGIGPDSSVTAVLLSGYSPSGDLPTLLLVTAGFGSVSSVQTVLLDGFFPVAPPTQQTAVCSTTSWTGLSLQENQSPSVAVGDTFYADFVTTPGAYTVSVATDGTVTVDAAGDLARQSFGANIFDASLGAFYGAFTVYINHHGPQLNAQPDDIAVIVGTAVSLDLRDYILLPQGGVFTSALQAGTLPTGVTLTGNVVSGTPTGVIQNDVTIRNTDPLGVYVDATFNFFVDPGAIMPDVVGSTIADATAAVVAAGLDTSPTPDSVHSEVFAAGTVLAQSPDPGATLFTGSTVFLVVSLGPQAVSGSITFFVEPKK